MYVRARLYLEGYCLICSLQSEGNAGLYGLVPGIDFEPVEL